MPLQKVTPEIETTLKLMKMRHVLDPKHFMKADKRKEMARILGSPVLRQMAVSEDLERRSRSPGAIKLLVGGRTSRSPSGIGLPPNHSSNRAPDNLPTTEQTLGPIRYNLTDASNSETSDKWADSCSVSSSVLNTLTEGPHTLNAPSSPAPIPAEPEVAGSATSTETDWEFVRGDKTTKRKRNPPSSAASSKASRISEAVVNAEGFLKR